MTLFDSAAWHREAAEEQGRPADRAGAHIGLYLAWLIRNDLHDPDVIPPAVAQAVADGTLRGSDIVAALGDALTTDAMTPEGADFTAWYYARYLDDVEAAFPDGVTDDDDADARIAPTIDRRHAEWIAASWAAEPSTLGVAGLGRAAGGAADEADDAAKPDDAAGDVEDRHDAPELEALLPRAVGGAAVHTISARASDWQSTLLRRAIERVGGEPQESFVALGLGGAGEDAFAVTLYAIPGVPQDRLEAEFSRDAYLPEGQGWEQRDVDGRTVWWSAAAEFDTAFYAMGGLVVTVGGSPERVRAALDVLP